MVRSQPPRNANRNHIISHIMSNQPIGEGGKYENLCILMGTFTFIMGLFSEADFIDVDVGCSDDRISVIAGYFKMLFVCLWNLHCTDPLTSKTRRIG